MPADFTGTEREDTLSEASPQASSSFAFERWYWPTIALLGWLIFELTLEPAVAVMVLCFRFGWQDFSTAVWLRRTDPLPARAQACLWFSLAAGCTRMLVGAFGLLMLIVTLEMIWNGPPAPGARGAPPAGFYGVAIVFVADLPLVGVFSLLGFRAAHLGGGPIWLDPALHRARRHNAWPPAGFGLRNHLDLPYLVTVAVLLLMLGAVCVATGVNLAQWLLQNLPALGLLVGFPLLASSLCLMLGFLGLLGLARLLHNVRATRPEQCWSR